MQKGSPNQAQAEMWNEDGGRTWADLHATLDMVFQPLATVLVEEVLAAGGERVLDVGCGAGGTTLAVASALKPNGVCTGIDISAPLIATATARAAAEKLGNVTFIRGDAQTYVFTPGSCDMVISRLGVMFFDDPGTAFASLRRAARPAARLAFIAWRGRDQNPFMAAAERAAAAVVPDFPVRNDDGPGQFGFASAARVEGILQAGGWTAIDIRPLDLACSFPAAHLSAYATRMGPYGRVRETLDETARAQADAAVLAAFEPYVEGEQVRFTSACWLVKARA
jgi:SAM-dependent methyltransferase